MNANRSVNFGESPSLLFKNYAQFSGRSSRSAYWWYFLWALIIGVGALIIDVSVFGLDLDDPSASGPIGTITELVLLIPGITLSVRRLHDVNKSGWWSMIAFTVIGIIPLIMWSMRAGMSGPNDFGPDAEAGRS